METVASEDTEEIGLLDIAVAIAESWKLLVIVPLLAGLSAAFAMYVAFPRDYESAVILRVSADEAALLQSARVLDPAMRASSWLVEHGGSISRARTALIEAMKVEAVKDTGFYRVTLSHHSPGESQAFLSRIITEYVAQSAPTGTVRAMLELRLESLEQGLAELNTSLERLNRAYDRLLAADDGQAAISLGEIGQSIVALVGNIETRRQQIAALQEQLNGSVTPDDVIQPPTLPDSPASRGIAVRVILVVLGTGFAMLLFAFAREGLRRAARSPEGAGKIARIRGAFRLGPRTPAGGQP